MSYFGNNLNNRKQRDLQQQEEEGEIQSSSSSDLEDGEINEGPEINNQERQEIYDSYSSEQQDKNRLEEQKKKREDFWKSRNQVQPDIPNDGVNLFELAMEAAAKTNKRMLVLRRKNAKRVEQLENMRMVQQPYLMGANTHYRGSVNQYPIMTIDERGRSYVHSNSSLRVSESRLDQFIQKNIGEEGTSNYLNQVVKFENFAYQHRKKRRQNLQ